MKIGDTVNYYGKLAKVLDLDSTHCLIQFTESRLKLCTPKSTFNKK